MELTLSTGIYLVILWSISGLIYGAAIGDAIGIATENMDLDECKFYYDPVTLTYTDIARDSHRVNWRPGDWTIDFDQLVCYSVAWDVFNLVVIVSFFVTNRSEIKPVLYVAVHRNSIFFFVSVFFHRVGLPE